MKGLGIDDASIARLIVEAESDLGSEAIYDLALDFLDAAAMKAAEPLTTLELETNFAVAGFAAGIRYTCKHLEVTESDDEKEIDAMNAE